MTTDGADSYQAGEAHELDSLMRLVSGLVLPWIAGAGGPQARTVNFLPPKDLERRLDLSLPDAAGGRQELLRLVGELLQYSANTWSPGFMDKLYASTNAVGVVSEFLLGVLNTGSHVYQVSPVLTLMERQVSRQLARLFGLAGEHAGGLTFPGGSSSNLHSAVTARNLMFPESKISGSGALPLVLFTSAHGHYSVTKAAIVMGLGSRAVEVVVCDDEGRMRADELDRRVRETRQEGRIPFYVNATAGTTVMGSFDPFEEIAAVCAQHGLWLHVDASWGGGVVFSPTHRHKVRGCERADSITINPHKMLGTPLQCSFLLLSDARKLQQANTLRAEYLFHERDDRDDELYDLADGTVGCGRRADALKLYLSWAYYGKEGLQQRVDRAFENALYLARRIDEHPRLILCSQLPPPCLQVCFYAAPSGRLDAASEKNSAVTRRVVANLTRQGRFLVDYSPGPQGDFIRAVLNSPGVRHSDIDELITAIDHQRE